MKREWPTVRSRGLVYSHPRSDPYGRDADRNFNHAPNVVRCANGRLVIAWFSGPWEGHHFQAILSSHSFDGGFSWTGAELVSDTHGLPDFDPAFLYDRGKLWCFFTYNAFYARLRGYEPGLMGTYGMVSEDDGDTWTPPLRLCEPEYGGPRSNAIILKDGTYAVPIYSQDGGARMLLSRDHGSTWIHGESVHTPHGADEPTVAELSDGRLLMYLRTTDGKIWKTVSLDGGRGWGKAEQTDLPGNKSSHCLYVTADGVLLLAHNPCQPLERTPLVLRMSEDDGTHWSDPFVLDQMEVPTESGSVRHPSGVDSGVSYPSIAENENGDIVVVWSRYWITDKEHCGDIAFAVLGLH